MSVSPNWYPALSLLPVHLRAICCSHTQDWPCMVPPCGCSSQYFPGEGPVTMPALECPPSPCCATLLSWNESLTEWPLLLLQGL
jgi:hypothetical protein